jgi:hypothetical protein
MRLIEVPAKTGYAWFRQGIWVFRRNPVAFMLLFVAYLFAWLLLSQVPVIGGLLPLLFVPGVSVGFMAACRNAIQGKPVYPTTLLSGFRDHGKVVSRRLLGLGLIYVLGMIAVFAASSFADGGILFRVAVLNSEIDITDISNGTQITGAMLIAALAYIPISIVMWFAPILVAWHDVPPVKALFFSWIALWRNRWAFTVYTLCWGALDIAITLPLTQIAALAGGSLLALMVMIPLMVAIVAMLYCSFYATYRGSFDVPDAPEPSAPAKPTV